MTLIMKEEKFLKTHMVWDNMESFSLQLKFSYPRPLQLLFSFLAFRKLNQCPAWLKLILLRLSEPSVPNSWFERSQRLLLPSSQRSPGKGGLIYSKMFWNFTHPNFFQLENRTIQQKLQQQQILSQYSSRHPSQRQLAWTSEAGVGLQHPQHLVQDGGGGHFLTSSTPSLFFNKSDQTLLRSNFHREPEMFEVFTVNLWYKAQCALLIPEVSIK